MSKAWYACLFLVLACSGDSTGPSSNTGTLRIHNSTSASIVQVYTPTCAATTLGPNVIAGSAITPGQSRDFSLAVDCYDVGVITSDNRTAAFNATHITKNTVTPIEVTN